MAQQAAQEMSALTSTLASLYGAGSGTAAPSLPPGSTAPPAAPPPSLPPAVATSVLDSVALLIDSFSAAPAPRPTASDGTAEGDAEAKVAAQAEKEEVVAALTAGADLVGALLSATETVGESTAVAATSALSNLVGGLLGQLSGGGDSADGDVGDSASATAAASSVQSAATSLAARAMDNLITMAALPSGASGGGSGATGPSSPPPPPLTLRTANLNLTLSVTPASELGDTPFACDTASTPVEVVLPPGMMKLLSAAGWQGTEDDAVGVIFTVTSLNLHGGTRADLTTAGPLVSFSLRQAGAALKVDNLSVPINLTLPRWVANVGARSSVDQRRLNILLGEIGGGSAAGRRLAEATANASSHVCAGQPTQDEAAALLEELLKTNNGSAASEVAAELRAVMRGAGCDEAVECNYWAESTGAWSGANCQTTGSSDAGVGCSCNHLTDFIVVVVPPPPSAPPPSPPWSLSPPSPLPSPPPPPASFAVKWTVTIAGAVSDFTEAVLTPMRQKVAGEASVSLEAVEATATAGSVTVGFTVNLQSEAAAATALTAITAKFADIATASNFLSTAALAVSVLQITETPMKLVLASPPPPLSPPALPPGAPPPADDAGGSFAMIGGIVGGAVGACLLLAAACGLFYRYLKAQKRPVYAEANVKANVKF